MNRIVEPRSHEDTKVLEPALRFPEFSESWSLASLNDLAAEKFSNGVFNDPKKVGSGFRLINVKDMFVGDFVDVENLTLIELEQKEFEKNRVSYGDVFFTRSSLVAEGIAVSNICLSNDTDITYDGHLVRMRPDLSILNPMFLGLALKTSYLRRQLIVRGKTTTMTTIGQEDIKTVNLSYPTIEEQQKIADFLSSVDKKIEQLTEKHRLLTEYKKGVMQQIFTQQIRFKDNQGNDYPEWEEKQLGSLVAIMNGLTYSPDDIVEDGLLVLRSSNIKNGRLVFTDNVFVNVEVKKTAYTQENDILVCVRNGSKRLIGKNVLVKGCFPKATHGAFMTVLRGDSNEFLSHWFQMDGYYKQVHQNLGATINSINGSDLKKFKLSIPPSKEEQQKIANFLTEIDQKIDQAWSTLEQTKALKKGLLQQMFI